MKQLTLITAIVISLFTTACTIKVPQVAALQKSVQQPIQNIDEFAWSLQYEDYQTEVYAVSTDEGTMFASYDNDSLLFDGYAIKRIDGLANENAPLFFENTSRVDASGKGFVDAVGRTTSLQCLAKTATGAVARQLCVSKDGTEWVFELAFDANGTLSTIKQTVNNSGSVVILKKK